jgi:pimeloyl-ACP methyl ester carboxylesterase
MMDVRPTVVYGDLLACSNFNVEEQTKEISVPTRVICGSEDKMTPLKLSEYLVDNLPNASLSSVEGAGHMVMLEKPEEVSKDIRAFLEDGITPTL